jgi:hypothetical protein
MNLITYDETKKNFAENLGKTPMPYGAIPDIPRTEV